MCCLGGFGVWGDVGGGTKIIDFLYNLRSTVPLYHGGGRGVGQESKVFNIDNQHSKVFKALCTYSSVC